MSPTIHSARVSSPPPSDRLLGSPEAPRHQPQRERGEHQHRHEVADRVEDRVLRGGQGRDRALVRIRRASGHVLRAPDRSGPRVVRDLALDAAGDRARDRGLAGAEEEIAADRPTDVQRPAPDRDIVADRAADVQLPATGADRATDRAIDVDGPTAADDAAADRARHVDRAARDDDVAVDLAVDGDRAATRDDIAMDGAVDDDLARKGIEIAVDRLGRWHGDDVTGADFAAEQVVGRDAADCRDEEHGQEAEDAGKLEHRAIHV
jgi:hypothetical protein